MQGTGWKYDLRIVAIAFVVASTRSQCISRLRSTCSLPTTGMLFSAWQAIMQALQPTQRSGR